MRGDKSTEINDRLWDPGRGFNVGIVERDVEIGEIDQRRFAAIIRDKRRGGGGKLLGKRALARRPGKDQNARHLVDPEERTTKHQHRAGGLKHP